MKRQKKLACQIISIDCAATNEWGCPALAVEKEKREINHKSLRHDLECKEKPPTPRLPIIWFSHSVAFVFTVPLFPDATRPPLHSKVLTALPLFFRQLLQMQQC